MKQTRKVLIPTKFEELSFLVVRQLLHLQQAGLQEMLFLHVVEREEVSFDPYRGLDEKYARKLEEEANLRFGDWESQLSSSGVRCRHRVELGSVASKILEVAQEEKVDLIVAGREHGGLMNRVYLGGTSMTLLRNTRLPLMICKPRREDDDLQEVPNLFERVLLATDFSVGAERARQILMGLDGACKRVDVVHVLNERDLDGHGEGELTAIRRQAQEALDALLPEFGALNWRAQTHLLAGRTAEEILRARRDQDSTLVIMGTTGKHGLKEMWLGSASHRVTELSPVPVILVPAGD